MAQRFPCELISLEQVYDLSYELADAILGSDFRPDVIVAIARGGFVPARFLCDFLAISDLACIKVQHYGPGARREGEARVRYSLAGKLEDRRVLLVDDVNDSGDTLRVAVEHLSQFAPETLRSAVLHEKESSSTQADYRACRVRGWHWITYPWAVVEDIGGFVEQMEPRPQTLQEIRERLRRDYDLELAPGRLEQIFSLRRER